MINPDRSRRPEVHPFNGIDFPMPEVMTLDNGTKVYVCRYPDFDVVHVDLLFGGGLMQQRKPHLCNFMLQMLSQGTTSATAAGIASKLDFCGLAIKTQAYDNFSSVSGSSTKRHAGELISIIEDMVKNAVFPEREFEILADKTVETLRYAMSLGNVMASDKFGEMMFGKSHPLGIPLDADNVKNVGIEDLREFYRAHFSGSNLTIVLSGNVGDAEMSFLQEAFGGEWGNPVQLPTVAALPVTASPGIEIVGNESLVQSSLEIGLLAPLRDNPDYQALRCLIYLLGGFYGSRLMQNIREDKGYTYGISASLIGHENIAFVDITTNCDVAYTQSVIDEVRREIGNLRTSNISDQELGLLKNSMLKNMASRIESPFSFAKQIANLLTIGETPEYLSMQLSVIRNLSVERLEDVARKYMNSDDLRIAVASNEKVLKKLI